MLEFGIKIEKSRITVDSPASYGILEGVMNEQWKLREAPEDGAAPYHPPPSLFHRYRYSRKKLPVPPLFPREYPRGRGMKALGYLSALAAAGALGAAVILACSDPTVLPTHTNVSGNDFDTLKAAGNRSPQEIWSDGTTMWVADWGREKIYAYSMSTKARESAKDFDTLAAAGNRTPQGIWSDGTTMWVADPEDDKIYAYSMSTKARDSAKDFNTLKAARNNRPKGIWSDGTTMWVADWGDNKIHAYSMSTKARDSTKDFDTIAAAENRYPGGIWSDGTTMWVADWGREKIYAYSMATKARTP